MQGLEQTLTSMEVAEMVGKQHNELLKDIRRYSEQLGQGKIPQSDFFTENTYQNSQNKTMPCYLVTKKGCEFIAHKLTGTKGTEFTACYIEKFHAMEDTLSHRHAALSPQLQALQAIVDQMAEQERKLAEQDSRIEKVEGICTAVQEIYTTPIADWKEEVNSRIRKISQKSGIEYRALYTELYMKLESRARCDLNRLQENKRKRLAEAGRTKTYIDNECTKIAIIFDNVRLKEIFETIVKECAIKYVA